MKLPPINLNKAEYLIDISKGKSLGRKFVSKLDKAGAILPVLLLEGTVTGGRTYQAYKRDGFVEARERVTEESLGAIFWLFGATMAAKVFDKIGINFFKVPKNLPDVGRDAVRNPFDNYMKDLSRILNLSPEKTEQVKKRLARFAVGRTIASIVTACLFIGYVVPKMNQAITNNLFAKKKNKNNATNTNTEQNKNLMQIKSAKDISINAVENFKAKITNEKNTNKLTTISSQPSFKAGADSLLRIVQNFQENDVWKLLGTDVGTITGRTANARNNDERVEILFRDTASIYFYCFSMPAIVAFMNRRDTFKGLNTRLNPVTAAQVHNRLIEAMAEKGVNKMTPKAFRKFALGSGDYDKQFYNKLFSPRTELPQKKYLFGLIQKKQKQPTRVISLADFERVADSHFSNRDTAEKLKKLARSMSKMQPEKLGQKILTETQVDDILRGGILREPEFLIETINDILKSKSDLKPLQNKYKYIPLEKIEGFRNQILDYAKAIALDARKNKTNVSWESMMKMNKRNTTKNGLFMALAMSISAAFLSTIIPKIQYYITYKRTGKKSFPGTNNQ